MINQVLRLFCLEVYDGMQYVTNMDATNFEVMFLRVLRRGAVTLGNTELPIAFCETTDKDRFITPISIKSKRS